MSDHLNPIIVFGDYSPDYVLIKNDTMMNTNINRSFEKIITDSSPDEAGEPIVANNCQSQPPRASDNKRNQQ